MRNIHLCAAAEGVSFARFLNVDMAQYYELVNAAAGGSAMFRARAPSMMNRTHPSPSVSVVNGKDGIGIGAETRSLGDAVAELSRVVAAAREVECPLHLGNAALNILFSGVRRGLDAEPDASVCRVWE